MTNEEMQRTMDFIVAHQAQFTASMQRLDEERIRDAPRLARLEESFLTLVQLAETTDARLDELELRVPRLEESYQRLVRLVEKADARLNRPESRVQE